LPLLKHIFCNKSITFCYFFSFCAFISFTGIPTIFVQYAHITVSQFVPLVFFAEIILRKNYFYTNILRGNFCRLAKRSKLLNFVANQPTPYRKPQGVQIFTPLAMKGSRSSSGNRESLTMVSISSIPQTFIQAIRPNLL